MQREHYMWVKKEKKLEFFPAAYLPSATKSTKYNTALLKHCNHLGVTLRDTCLAVMNTHSALYWEQRNAPLNVIFDKGKAEQEFQFRKQVFTSIKNEILFLLVIALPGASATLENWYWTWLDVEPLEICEKGGKDKNIFKKYI